MLVARPDECHPWNPNDRREPTLEPCPDLFLSAHRDISFSFVLLLSCAVNSKYRLQLCLSPISYIGALSSYYSIEE